MKKLLVAVAIGMALNTPVLHAATKNTSPPQAASSPQAEDPAEFDKNVARWQEKMNEMQAQMDQLRKTQDPKERQKLLDEHWATMQSAMSIMHGMWGPRMMGPGMMGGAGQGGGHMGGYYSHMTPGQLRQRQYMTDQYLRMQQEMMNNMMWQQQYRMGPPPAGTQ
ncbi:hypothetical protein P0D72_40025 [Paraburkholderia sediminicola]|uniref:hypothetical protein n=1 Tax=Paraburkholderia sediminicola TaxID=458836 RepID=UPI0038BA7B46